MPIIIPSVPPFVFAVLFIPSFTVMSCYFLCFSQFDGNSHFLVNFDKFRDAALLRGV